MGRAYGVAVMMIGGKDYTLLGKVEPEDIKNLLFGIKSFWNYFIFEKEEVLIELIFRDPEVISFDCNWSIPAEAFFYEGYGAYHSWKANGLTDDNDDGMIHVILEPDAMCFVGSGSELMDKHIYGLMNYINGKRSTPGQIIQPESP